MNKERDEFSYYFAKTSLVISALELSGYDKVEKQLNTTENNKHLGICHYSKEGESRYLLRVVRNIDARTMLVLVNVSPEFNHDDIARKRKILVLDAETENYQSLLNRIDDFLDTISEVKALLDLHYKKTGGQ